MARFESFLAKSRIADAKEEVLAFRNDKLIRCAMDSHISVIGEGEFGIVRKASLNRTTVVAVFAVKYCNKFSHKAQHYLCNEILMNCHIASKFPHLMGLAVPRFVAVVFDDWAGPVLITEMVGHGVDKNERYLSIVKSSSIRGYRGGYVPLQLPA